MNTDNLPIPPVERLLISDEDYLTVLDVLDQVGVTQQADSLSVTLCANNLSLLKEITISLKAEPSTGLNERTSDRNAARTIAKADARIAAYTAILKALSASMIALRIPSSSRVSLTNPPSAPPSPVQLMQARIEREERSK